MSSRADRVGFVTELPDYTETGRWTGRFAAHWESDDGAHGEGPQSVSLEQAIAWARDQAVRVSVVIGGDDPVYSAGEEDFDDDGPRWPAEGIVVRERPSGTPLDGSQQEVEMAVEVDVRGLRRPSDDELARLRRVLLKAARMRGVEIVRERGRVRIDCTYLARSMVDSVADVDRVANAAVRELRPDAHVNSTGALGPASEVLRTRARPSLLNRPAWLRWKLGFGRPGRRRSRP